MSDACPWQIQIVVFGCVAIQCFSFSVSSELGFVFYGFSAFVMWMRTLHFILVQQDLGQVTRLWTTNLLISSTGTPLPASESENRHNDVNQPVTLLACTKSEPRDLHQEDLNSDFVLFAVCSCYAQHGQ
jgi:hypothetical protein